MMTTTTAAAAIKAMSGAFDFFGRIAEVSYVRNSFSPLAWETASRMCGLAGIRNLPRLPQLASPFKRTSHALVEPRLEKQRRSDHINLTAHFLFRKALPRKERFAY